MTRTRSALLYFLITVGMIALLTLFGPQEKSLGSNVRIVYLHGAWVLAAQVAFLAAALAGLVGLILKKDGFHAWSAALGRTGLIFWLSYLPLSLRAMQSNWNGLFLAEPRFRLAIIFAVTGILLQAGLWLLDTPWLTSLGNIVYVIVLRVAFSSAQDIMHPPPSPIFGSGLWNVISFFVLLNVLACVAGTFLTRFFLSVKTSE